MDLMIPPPKARYGIVTLTLPGHAEPYLEVGPVLAASYNRQQFEILYPFRAVVQPLAWEIVETYGFLNSPDEALWRYMNNKGLSKEAVFSLLSQSFDKQYGEREYGGADHVDGPAVIEMPARRLEVLEMRTMEVAV